MAIGMSAVNHPPIVVMKLVAQLAGSVDVQAATAITKCGTIEAAARTTCISFTSGRDGLSDARTWGQSLSPPLGRERGYRESRARGIRNESGLGLGREGSFCGVRGEVLQSDGVDRFRCIEVSHGLTVANCE